MTIQTLKILPDKKALEITWNDGCRARFHAIWLMDNGLDDETRSPVNGQRLTGVLDIPDAAVLTVAQVTETGDLCVVIAPDMKQLTFPSRWLKDHIYDGVRTNEIGYLDSAVTLWGADFQNQIPTEKWDEVCRSQSVLAGWLSAVQHYGFAVLQGLPVISGQLCQVAELFGCVRETNYGRWFDVRSEINPNNLAYTNLGLQAHTDNPYRDPVPTLQLLACLENSVDGGHSILVDGFNVADRLRQENLDAFDVLSRYNARFDYQGSKNVHLKAKKPVIELGPDGEILAIRFNNRSSAPVVDVPYDDMEKYYAALRSFATLIENETMQVRFKLSPGELFIVDNTRVLHARSAFSSSGSRWLQGCYADKDGLLSTLRIIDDVQN